MLVGIIAHTGHTVCKITKYAAAIFAGDHRKAAGTYRVALLRAKERIDLRFFGGDDQFSGMGMKLLYNAVDFRPRMELRAKVRDCRIAQIPLCHIQIVTVAVHKAAARTNRQHPAGNAGTSAVEILTGGEEVTLVAAGHPTGSLGAASGALHLGDDHINAGPNHVSEYKVGPFLPRLPHLRLADQNGDTVRHYNGAELLLVFKQLGFAA